MSNEELTEEEQRLVREGIDVIPVRIKVYLGKYFNKIHKYECINLDTDKMFVLQTADTGLGFEADKCYTIPILKSDKEFKNLADSRTMNGRFLELIYTSAGIKEILDFEEQLEPVRNAIKKVVFKKARLDIHPENEFEEMDLLIGGHSIEAIKVIEEIDESIDTVGAVKILDNLPKPNLYQTDPPIRTSKMTTANDKPIRTHKTPAATALSVTGSQLAVSPKAQKTLENIREITKPVKDSIKDKLELNLESIRILNPKATEQNAMKFLQKCIWQNLNPFIGDCYLITYENSQTKEQDMSMVVSKDVFLKRSALEPKYEGFEAGIIVKVGDVLESRQGAMYIKGDETLIGGWAKVFVKGLPPFFAGVLVSEYTTSKSLWNSKPATMIRKVALSQAMREAFPAQFQGMYEESELDLEENKK